MVDDLYQEIILDHSKRPRNCHPMDDANRKAEGYNPLCGDKLKLYLEDGRRHRQGCQLRGLGLRHLDRFGFADDREPEGQDARGSSEAAREVPRPADHRYARQPRTWASWWSSAACAIIPRA